MPKAYFESKVEATKFMKTVKGLNPHLKKDIEYDGHKTYTIYCVKYGNVPKGILGSGLGVKKL